MEDTRTRTRDRDARRESASHRAHEEPNLIEVAFTQGIGFAEQQAVSEFKDARPGTRDRDARKDPSLRRAHSAGDVIGKAPARNQRRETGPWFDASHTPTSTRHEKDERPRPHSMGRSSSSVRASTEWGATGVTKRNEKYDRTINHTRCDQTLLDLCRRAIDIKEQHTGKPIEGKEGFLWRCLAQPEAVRSQLKAEDIHIPSDPVKHLIQKAGDFKEQWMRGKRSNERWQSKCTSCGNRPFVSWDACFRCGSLAGTT